MELTLVTLAVYALAVFRICRLIIEDTITEPIRNAIWKKFPPHTAFGYLITCYWCTSMYVASLIIICSILVPSVVFIICSIFALSALAGIISHIMDRG